MRKQAAWGLFSCIFLLGLGACLIYLEQIHLCSLCLALGPLIAVIGLIFLLVLVTHPRRTACRLYAFLVSLLSFFGLALTLRHLAVQLGLEQSLPQCTGITVGEARNMSFDQPYQQVISGIEHCLDNQTLSGIPLNYLFFCIFFLFSIYSLFLLFRRIDRDIFR